MGDSRRAARIFGLTCSYEFQGTEKGQRQGRHQRSSAKMIQTEVEKLEVVRISKIAGSDPSPLQTIDGNIARPLTANPDSLGWRPDRAIAAPGSLRHLGGTCCHNRARCLRYVVITPSQTVDGARLVGGGNSVACGTYQEMIRSGFWICGSTRCGVARQDLFLDSAGSRPDRKSEIAGLDGKYAV